MDRPNHNTPPVFRVTLPTDDASLSASTSSSSSNVPLEFIDDMAKGRYLNLIRY